MFGEVEESNELIRNSEFLYALKHNSSDEAFLMRLVSLAKEYDNVQLRRFYDRDGASYLEVSIYTSKEGYVNFCTWAIDNLIQRARKLNDKEVSSPFMEQKPTIVDKHYVPGTWWFLGMNVVRVYEMGCSFTKNSGPTRTGFVRSDTNKSETDVAQHTTPPRILPPV